MDRKESSANVPLIYKRAQSEDRWAEKFVKAALQFVHGSEEYNKFKPVADDIAASLPRLLLTANFPICEVFHQEEHFSRGSH